MEGRLKSRPGAWKRDRLDHWAAKMRETAHERKAEKCRLAIQAWLKTTEAADYKLKKVRHASFRSTITRRFGKYGLRNKKMTSNEAASIIRIAFKQGLDFDEFSKLMLAQLVEKLLFPCSCVRLVGSAPSPLCPTCGCALFKVRNESSYLNDDQFDAVKAGDWFCHTCVGKEARSGFKYWWNRELKIKASPVCPRCEEMIMVAEGLRGKLFKNSLTK